MGHSPYESPAEAENPAPQRIPWKWVLVTGLLTSLFGYLAMITLVLSNEPRPGVRELPTTTLVIVVAYLLLGLMVLGALTAIIGGIGWLLNWLRRYLKF